MFSKSRINEPGPKQAGEPEVKPTTTDTPKPAGAMPAANAAPKPKAPASTLSSDLVVKGNMKSTGDIIIEIGYRHIVDFQIAIAGVFTAGCACFNGIHNFPIIHKIIYHPVCFQGICFCRSLSASFRCTGLVSC